MIRTVLDPPSGRCAPELFSTDLAGVLAAGTPTPAAFPSEARLRPTTEQAKGAKDLRQASQLIEVMLDDRPGDLAVTWEQLKASEPFIRRVAQASGRLQPELRQRLEATLHTTLGD